MDETKPQGDSIVFINVPKAYIPQEDLTVRFERSKDVAAGTRDWVGLFRVGWTSIRDYYTFEWAPITSENPADNKVIFSGRRLPPDDGCFYQFCYVSREGVMRGASVPFQFTKAACCLNLDDVETVDVVEEGLESIVELRHKDTLEGAVTVTTTTIGAAEQVQATGIPPSTIPTVDEPRQTEYERVKEELSECKKQIATLEVDKSAAVQSKVDMATRLNDAQNQAKTSRDMHARLSERLDKEMATCNELKATNEKLSIRCQETETEAKKLDAQCQQLSAEKADLIKQLNSTVQQRDSLETTLHAKLQAVKESRDQMEKMVEQSAHKVKELEQYLAVRENELSSIQQHFLIEKQQLEKHLLEQQTTAETMRKLEEKNQQLEAQLLKQQTICAAQMQELHQKAQSAEELNAQLQAQLAECEHQFEISAKDSAMKNVPVLNEFDSQPFCAQPSSGCVDKAAHEALQVAYENMEKYYRKVNTELEGCHVQLREAEAKASKLSDQCDELKKRIEMGKVAYETVARENANLKRMLNTSLGDQNKASDDDKMRSIATKASKQMVQYQKQIEELQEMLERQEKQYKQTVGELEESLKRQADENKHMIDELEQKLVGEMNRVEKLVQEKANQEKQYNVTFQEMHAELESSSQQAITALESKLTDLQDHLDVTLQELNKRNNENAQQCLTIKQLEEGKQSLEEKFTELQRKYREQCLTIKQLEEGKQSLEEKFTELQRKYRALSARSEPPVRPVRDSGLPYVPSPPHVHKPYDASQAAYSTRICPVCGTKFPQRIVQSDFEQHVHAHFSA